MNAANEVAVAAFLEGLIPFGAIADTNRTVLDAHLAEQAGTTLDDLAAVWAVDEWSRAQARQACGITAPTPNPDRSQRVG